MSVLVTNGPSSLPTSCAAYTQQHHSYFNANMLLCLTMTAIIVNSIYSMMIYNEVRRLRKHLHEAENNIKDGGALLYSIIANMRECLMKLVDMVHLPKMKSIAQKYEDV